MNVPETLSAFDLTKNPSARLPSVSTRPTSLTFRPSGSVTVCHHVGRDTTKGSVLVKPFNAVLQNIDTIDVKRNIDKQNVRNGQTLDGGLPLIF